MIWIFYFIVKMDHPQTVSSLLTTLRSSPSYHGLTDYYIKKKIGQEQGITNVKKEHVMVALRNLPPQKEHVIYTPQKEHVIYTPKSEQLHIQEALHNDVLYNILLQASAKDMTALCSTNQQTNVICHTKQFWLDKIKQQQVENVITTEDKTTKEWIVAFDIASYEHNADVVIELIKTQTPLMISEPKKMFHFEFKKYDDVSLIVPMIKHDYHQKMNKYKTYKKFKQGLSITIGCEIKLIYGIYQVAENPKIKKIISWHELKLIIMRFMYYFPNQDIIDSYGSLLFYKKLKLIKEEDEDDVEYNHLIKDRIKILKNRVV